MAIYFDTSDPKALLAAFKKGVDQGHITTWSYDEAGDFTHTPPQWARRGWLRPLIENGQLTMKFLGRASEVTTYTVYAVYHGRFVESMMTHCDQLFDEARVPPRTTSVDSITTKVA